MIPNEAIERIRKGEQVTLVVPPTDEELAERLASRHKTPVLRRWQRVVLAQLTVAYERKDLAMIERQQRLDRILAAAVDIREFS
jgi:hypothetical protein